jgi:hypothetical protein
MLQFLSSFDLGHLYGAFSSSISRIDQPFSPAPHMYKAMVEGTLIQQSVLLFPNDDSPITSYTLAMNHKLYSNERRAILIDTDVLYIGSLCGKLLQIYLDGSVELRGSGSRTQLRLPHGIRSIYSATNASLEEHHCLETLDNRLFVFGSEPFDEEGRVIVAVERYHRKVGYTTMIHTFGDGGQFTCDSYDYSEV